MAGHKHWTEIEMDKLKIYYPFSTSNELIKIFDKSQTAINRKAQRLGLNKSLEAIHKIFNHEGIRNPMYGKTQSIETKDLIALKATGRKIKNRKQDYHLSDIHKLHISEGGKGKIVSDKTRKLISRNALERYGNLRKSVERFSSYRWRSVTKLIRKRDNFTCQYCVKHAHNVHHIVPFAFFQNNEAYNLQTLCGTCHRKAESAAYKYLLELKEQGLLWY